MDWETYDALAVLYWKTRWSTWVFIKSRDVASLTREGFTSQFDYVESLICRLAIGAIDLFFTILPLDHGEFSLTVLLTPLMLPSSLLQTP